MFIIYLLFLFYLTLHRDMHRDLCSGRPGLCDAMKPTKGSDLLKYLRKVEFQGIFFYNLIKIYTI